MIAIPFLFFGGIFQMYFERKIKVEEWANEKSIANILVEALEKLIHD